MKQEYREAFTEVSEIFMLMPQELLNKIPEQFQKLIRDNREINYVTNISEPLENVQLKDETIIILGLIYRDFLTPLDRRKELQMKDAKELAELKVKLEEEAREKYDINKVFENRQLKVEDKSSQSNMQMIEYKKESFISKIINKIKSFFNRGEQKWGS